MTAAAGDMPGLPHGVALTGRRTLEALLTETPAAPGPAAAAQLGAAASNAVGSAVSVLVRADGEWSVVAGDPPTAPLKADELDRRRRRGAGIAVAGRVALLWEPSRPVASTLQRLLRIACSWLSMAFERDDALERAKEASDESDVHREVAGQLLTVRDLDQVLLSIVVRTLHLLDADICGVLLLEGDEVRMRSCSGNRFVETARLRMRRGQGVAGLVFQTGRPAKVDDYLADTTISDDFITLAKKEGTRSALAVPLRLQGELVGVLEVWRRRPSLFAERDVRRMVALAELATIAIDNARLNDRQTCALAQLKEARNALEHQVTVLALSSGLQQKLLNAVLEGGGLPVIARTVASELDCQVGVYGPEGALITAHGGTRATTCFPARVPARTRPGRRTLRLTEGEAVTAWTQPIYADGDQIGAVYLIPGERSEKMMDVVSGQAAMACSLSLLRERAASRARIEELEQVLWDLLQGSVEHRIAARTRANQMNVSLRGALRVVYGRIENVEELAARHGWDTSRTDRVRRDILRMLRGLEEGAGIVLAAIRGDAIAAIVANLDRSAVRDLVSGLTAAVHRQWPDLRLTWGVSRAHDDVVALPSAFNQAKTALSAAHRLGGENVFLYEELGIVRLLLGSGSDPDLQAFITEVTGPLIAYDRENNGALIRTLRAFFDADCLQRVAAERLFVHYKTLRYRLDQIERLTGLNLDRHDDRMRADFALRLLQVNGQLDDVETTSDPF